MKEEEQKPKSNHWAPDDEKDEFDGADFAELVRWVTLSVQGTAYTSCAATADAVRG